VAETTPHVPPNGIGGLEARLPYAVVTMKVHPVVGMEARHTDSALSFP
jgi:hypothetical protein